MTNQAQPLTNRVLSLVVIVTSLGYFVDFFDFLLFGMLRVKSLTDLGLSGDALTQSGLFIVNCQAAGIIIGAYISGVLGDRYGRKNALFLSILVYSLGSIACSFVQDVESYAAARFITAMGLAGELGTGVTLIAEGLSAKRRGYGVMVFISMGFLGGLAAGVIAELLPWRTCYLVGGAMGLVLLALRVLISESGMYSKMEGKDLTRGGLGLLFRKPLLLRRYLAAILIMTPGVLVTQVLLSLSPEFAKDAGIVDTVKVNIALSLGFTVALFTDFAAVALSEYLKSRKKAVLIFMVLSFLAVMKHLLWPAQTVPMFYLSCGLLGLVFGLWTICAFWAAEQFGTNIRATVATTVPNIARTLVIPMNLAYAGLKHYGALNAATIVSLMVFAIALASWYLLSETHGKNLDYYEEN